MNIIVITAVHGRHAVVKEMARACKKENLHVVASATTKKDIYLCRALGWDVVYAKNEPLWQKWQAALEFVRNKTFYGLLILGSDDIFTGIYVYRQLLLEYDQVGLLDCYAQNYRTKETVYWPGYPKDHKRHMETAGAGRLVKKWLVEACSYDFWKNSGHYSMDGTMEAKTMQIPHKYGRFKMDEIGVSLTDLKTDDNVQGFEKFKKACTK